MSSEVAIEVCGISKCYELYATPRDRLLQILIGKYKRFYREFWALRDVSFDVLKGETVGVIGRNGSGKSTLLQLICGTLAPSGGTVRAHGRIAALLELGSGFNPEFNGSENVFLNAAVMGLSRADVEARYDRILAFADIGMHIDQPLKTYSTGMLMRLAFAVAVHVDPSILVIDEALSVGDIRFQNKCFRKLNEFRESGSSILFVSHSPSMMEAFCDRVVWLEQGAVKRIGEPAKVVRDYVNFMAHGVTDSAADQSAQGAQGQASSASGFEPEWRWTSFGPSHNVRNAGGARIVEMRFRVGDVPGPARIDANVAAFELEMRVAYEIEVDRPLIGLGIFNQLNEPVVHFNTHNIGQLPPPARGGATVAYRLEAQLPALRPGQYLVAIGLDDGVPGESVLLSHVYDAWTFEVAALPGTAIQSGYIQTYGATAKVLETVGEGT